MRAHSAGSRTLQACRNRCSWPGFCDHCRNAEGNAALVRVEVERLKNSAGFEQRREPHKSENRGEGGIKDQRDIGRAEASLRRGTGDDIAEQPRIGLVGGTQSIPAPVIRNGTARGRTKGAVGCGARIGQVTVAVSA